VRLALRKSGHGGNTTHVVVVTGHQDVSVGTPAGSPRVLDDPVGLSSLNTPSNSQHTVVQLGSRAVGVRVDSRSVELEGGLRSVDGDGGGSHVDRVLQVGLGSLLDVLVGLQGGSRVGLVVSAGSVLSSVGIGGFGIDTSVLDDVFHGLSHQTTVASLVSVGSRAVNQVLLRETNQRLARDEVASLSRSSGGEGPARTALALILDSSDGSLGSPVEAGGQSLIGGDEGLSSSGGLALDSEVELSVFSVGKISHLVHSQGNSVLLGIPFIDVFLVGLEDGVSLLELFMAVGSSELLHPVHEETLVFALRSEGEGAGEEDGEDEDSFHS